MIRYIAFTLILTGCVTGQILTKGAFNLKTPPEMLGGTLLGNGIVDILTRDSLVLAGTGYGLNKTVSGGTFWQTFNSSDYIGKGGITAMGFMNDSIFWIATSFDTVTASGSLPAGGGLSYTTDSGVSWIHVPQPVDRRDETRYKPTTTNVQNLTFDISFLDTTIWIASFGGGLRRSDDMGSSWQVVTTDGIPFSALDYLNHRAFSVMSENGNIWVGTAGGISKSMDGGQTWTRYTSKNQEFHISGNFVVALAYQEKTGAVWAATNVTDSSETIAISKTTNGGASWEIYLENIFAHNFAFDGDRVYVATDEGMYLSDDGGDNWYLVPPIRDDQSGEEILTAVFYSAGVSREGGISRFWAGSNDGLASTTNNGFSWTVNRSFQSTRLASVPAVYAYPSPFSPSRQGYIRFQYDVQKAGHVTIDIYNFAMEHVASIREYESAPEGGNYDRSSKWDGRTASGQAVASGVYFFRADIQGRVSWGKLVVIN